MKPPGEGLSGRRGRDALLVAINGAANPQVNRKLLERLARGLCHFQKSYT